MKKALLFIITITLLQSNLSYAQKDSLVNIEEVVVKGFESNTRLQQVPASISIVGKSDLQRNSNYSLLPAFNNVSGVRMEERS
ncbi:MAG: TonB-dependent receptor, partial [Chitinophagaceae bacterium]